MAIKLSKQQQQYLVAGTVMLGAFGYAYLRFFWTPTSERIAKAQAEIEKTTEEISKAKKATARLADIEKELELLYQQDVENQKSLPKTKSVPEILVTLTSLARKYNVDVLNFSPGAQAPKPLFIELTYPMTIKGSFHNIGRFMASLALEERIYNMSNVNFGGADTVTGQMTISFTLLSYQYKG